MKQPMMRKLENYKPTRFMAKDSHYDEYAADFAVAFIESLQHTKGEWYKKPFELIDWQEQIVRDVFGTLKPNGYRQFTTAYVEIPKKMGKSELAAAIALYLTCADGEQRAEVYGCAADVNQAKIVFDVAVDMVMLCPALERHVTINKSTRTIVYNPTNSKYKVLSADVANKHGFNTHGVIFDELHTQPNRKLFDVMTKGSGDARKQPLFFLITTAGDNTNSICWEVHQKALDILEGRKIDKTFYPVIYGAAEDEDWTDPAVWKKANPSLGITVDIEKVQEACDSAKQNPGEENAFRQLRLNQWVKQSVRWMPMDKWDKCAFPVDEKALEGRVCYGGLDLSSTTDITAFVLVFPPPPRTSRPLYWCSLRRMRTTSIRCSRTSGCRRIHWTSASGETTSPTTSGRSRATFLPLTATSSTTASSSSSSRALASATTSARLPSTAGVLSRWYRIWRAWALPSFPSVRALRI